MILHDKVTLHLNLPTGRVDGQGNPIRETKTYEAPAQVWPLGTDAVVNGDRSGVVSRYRMVIAPVVDIPVGIGNNLRIGWGPYPVRPESATSGLAADGTVERHYLRNRLKHYELITTQVV